MSNYSNDLLLERAGDIIDDPRGLDTKDVQQLITAIQDGDLDEIAFMCSKLEAQQAVEHFATEKTDVD